MKKIALILAIGSVVTASFGQGFVNFANTSGPLVSTNSSINGLTGEALSGGSTGLTSGSGVAPNGFYYALLMQPYSGSGATVNSTLANLLTSGWIYTGALGVNALGAGKISGGANTQTTAGDPVPAGGSPNQFVVVGWSANEGTTWAAFSTALQSGNLVNGGFAGVSMTGTGLSSTSPSELIFGGTGITSPITLGLVVTPEPGTMALAGLGIAGLLALRRKK